MPSSLDVSGTSVDGGQPSDRSPSPAVLFRETRREAVPSRSLPELLGELERLARADGERLDDAQIREEITRIAATLTNAESAAYLEQDPSGSWRQHCQMGGNSEEAANASEQIHWRTHRERVLRDGVARLWMFDQLARRTVISAPVTRGERSECVSVTLRLGAEPPSSFVVALQLVATGATRIWQARERQRLVVEAQAAAAMVELQQRVAACENADAACRTVAELVKSVVGNDAVLVLWPSRASSSLAVRGASPSLPDDHSPELQRFAADVKSWLAEAPELYSCRDNADWARYAEFARRWDAPATLLLRISPEIGTSQESGGGLGDPPCESPVASGWGAIVLLGTQEALRGAAIQPFLRVLAEFVGTHLRQAERTLSRESPRSGWLPRFGATWGVAAAGVTMLALAFIPVPRRVLGTATCEPAERRFVVAPHAGLLAENCCQPGDRVEAEQVLARMDDRELNLELSALVADLEIAGKKRDAAFAAHEVAEQQLAELELQRLERRRELLATRRDNLEIRSPITGMVLSGQREVVRNQPLRAGQTLYEIAPAGSLLVEVAIDESDWRHLHVGDEAWVRWEGMSELELRGVVERIRPRTEIHDRENSIVIEVALLDPAPQLAPGMRGVARLAGSPEPILQTWTRRLRYRWWP